MFSIVVKSPIDEDEDDQPHLSSLSTDTQEYKVESQSSSGDQDTHYQSQLDQLDIKDEVESESDIEAADSSEETEVSDKPEIDNSSNRLGLVVPMKQEHSVFQRITQETSVRRRRKLMPEYGRKETDTSVPAYKTSRADETCIINPVLNIETPPFQQRNMDFVNHQQLALPVKQEEGETGSGATSRRPMLPPTVQTARAYRKVLVNPIPQIESQQTQMYFAPWYEQDIPLQPDKPIEKFTCERCGKSFRSSGILKRHIASHKSGQLHVCKICGKSFIQNMSLEAHALVHMGENPHKCTYCDQSFKYKFELDVHIQHHSGSPVLKGAHRCQECGFSFTSSSDLDLHKFTHIMKDSLVCEVCGKSCRTKAALCRHVIAHKDEYPHLCKSCGKMFKTNEEMLKHKKQHITGRRSYDCRVCGLGFGQKCALRSHMLLHISDKRNFECKLCGTSFPLMPLLEQHMESHVNST